MRVHLDVVAKRIFVHEIGAFNYLDHVNMKMVLNIDNKTN
jgi:hypothetical protein